MIDVATKKPILVKNDAETGPYIRLSRDQVDRVSKVLDEANIRYWVPHHSVSMDGGPFMTWVWIRKGVDPVRAQEVLDLAP